MQQFYGGISPSLRFKVHVFLYRRVIEKVPVICNHPNIISALVSKLGLMYLEPEQVIIEQYQVNAKNLYFTSAGHLNVFYFYTSLKRIELGTVVEGKMLGETEIIFQRNPVIQVESKSYTTLGVIEEEDSLAILQKNYEVRD